MSLPKREQPHIVGFKKARAAKAAQLKKEIEAKQKRSWVSA